MNGHGFTGGTGTSSRLLSAAQGGYTVGVLVQRNYGTRPQLRIAGLPVGRETTGHAPCVAQRVDPPIRLGDGSEPPLCDAGGRPPAPPEEEQGSIIIVVGTDAPLSPDQVERVVRRVALGIGRMGSNNGNGSGDIFLAFSTANRGSTGATAARPGRVAR
jgi:L-aminopeptidase/D-esterase-like protein